MHRNQFTPPTPFGGLIGHRGIAAHAPENTLSSFLLCKSQGVQWVEFDVRLTQDNEIILFHDDTLDRTTNGQGWVHEQTLNYLRTLDAGSWFSSKFAGEPIPLFKEILPKLVDLDLFLNIELKIPPQTTPEHENMLVLQLKNILEALWPKDKAFPLISSFHWNLLHKIRSYNEMLPLGFLHDACNESLLKTIARIPNAAFHCHYESLQDPILALIQDLQLPVLAYTVNDPNTAARLLQAGIFGVFSDDPLSLQKPPARPKAA